MVKIDVSVGDLCDRISILCIKRDKLGISIPELESYSEALDDFIVEGNFDVGLFPILQFRLRMVNKLLWEFEEDIREAHKEFNIELVLTLSRMISELNSTRSNIKKKINELVGDQSEPKTY